MHFTAAMRSKKGSNVGIAIATGTTKRAARATRSGHAQPVIDCGTALPRGCRPV